MDGSLQNAPSEPEDSRDLPDEPESEVQELAADELGETPESPADEAAIEAALNAVAEDPSVPHDFPFRRAAAKVREFPRSPGVYLMKDAAGRVIYVGKAKNLRARAGSYFLKGGPGRTPHGRSG